MSILDKIYKHKNLITKILPFGLLRNLNRAFFANKIDVSRYKNSSPVKKNDYIGINILASVFVGFSLKMSVNRLRDAMDKKNVGWTYYEYLKNEWETSEHESDYNKYNSPNDVNSLIEQNMIPEKLKYDINLVHAGPFAFFSDLPTLNKKMFDGRYNIYYFIWELEVPPLTYKPMLDFFDEIWTVSEHAAKCLKDKTTKPIKTIPYYISPTPNPNIRKVDLGLPENKFLILTMYDGGSDDERKNPLAGIKAFKKAFPTEDKDVCFVIKIGHPKEETINMIKEELKEYENIVLLTETLQFDEVFSLMSLCDVFLSLPRAEGFGLMIAEAMALGTPVITTNYSAQTEFINEERGMMVPYTLIPVTRKSALYQKGAMWADPDIDVASEHIISLYTDKALYERIAGNAKNHIEHNYSAEKIGGLIKNRIEEIKKTF